MYYGVAQTLNYFLQFYINKQTIKKIVMDFIRGDHKIMKKKFIKNEKDSTSILYQPALKQGLHHKQYQSDSFRFFERDN